MKLFTKVAGMCMFLALGFTSCKEEVEIKNSLSVSPDTPIEFSATGNEGVTLTVETDADKWSYTAPEWVTAEQSGNTLVVNVQDNSGEARNGSIDFTAGTADMVKINVLQHNADGGDGPVEGKVSGSIKDESGENEVTVKFDNVTTKATLKMKLAFAEALKGDANLSVFVDEAYLEEYNTINETECVILPAETLTAKEWPITVSAGSKEAELSLDVDGASLGFVTKYLLPLKVKVVSGDVNFANKDSRVNYLFTKVNPKEIKQMVCFEINDTNPLSAFEYKLEDGSYFFDAVVLFSGNMGWDSEADAVLFNKRGGEPVINGNIATLVSDYDKYIKPLHDAGIKVYMGIMPHHTPAGITTLSFNGCKWFAEEMAQIIKDCHLDGVFLDEEYLGGDGGPTNPEWFTPVAGGDYFAYQMKKEMKKACPWPTEVAVYQFGLGYGWDKVTDHENQSEHKVTEFADIMVADYGGVGEPQGEQTKKHCTGSSIELNRGYGSMTADRAKQIKEEGYGWMMWFAFNPDPDHNLCNLNRALPMFKETARGCYDQELLDPTGYYKKLGEGVYDPNRHEYK